VALAEFIRRGLVNATTAQDEIDCYTILDNMRWRGDVSKSNKRESA